MTKYILADMMHRIGMYVYIVSIGYIVKVEIIVNADIIVFRITLCHCLEPVIVSVYVLSSAIIPKNSEFSTNSSLDISTTPTPLYSPSPPSFELNYIYPVP